MKIKKSINNVKCLNIAGSSATTHLVFGIKDFEKIFEILFNHFDKYYCIIQMQGCYMYPKRSYSPLSNFLSGLSNDAWKSRSNLFKQKNKYQCMKYLVAVCFIMSCHSSSCVLTGRAKHFYLFLYETTLNAPEVFFTRVVHSALITGLFQATIMINTIKGQWLWIIR